MSINRTAVIDAMSRVQAVGNSEGLIPAYGVYVTQLPTRFWNAFAERLTRSVSPDMLETAEWLLVNAAQECGYHTGYGIITSDEWKAVVAPQIKEVPQDILYGAYAVLTAWGWAKSEVVEIVPDERMVVRAYDYYESDGVSYGKTARKNAFMICGITAAFMDLAYGGEYDPTGKTGLRTFKCEQTKGIECGDEYGEFVATRA